VKPSRSKRFARCLYLLLIVCGALATPHIFAQESRYVVIDQDAQGPAGTDLNSILLLLQNKNVNVLGITVVTGDGWRDEEVAHTLRLLELVGRTDIPVAAGAVFPLVRTQQWTHHWEQTYGKVLYQGAWSSFRPQHGPSEIPKLPEDSPSIKVVDEDAAHLLIRLVHQYPHQVTVYAAGPMTNIAQAISLDPTFAETANQLVIMGGSLNPHTDDKEYIDSPRHEFNLWFDPEASSITLHAHWPKITVTPVDVSIETHLTKEMLQKLSQTHSAAAQYIARYTRRPDDYLWDELAAAAWLDPSLITRERYVYIDVSTDKGLSYGDTVVWSDEDKPDLDLRKAHVQMDVDWPRFQNLFMQWVSAPTPKAKDPQMPDTPAEKK
jgi:inosine-uridine nucleoside N-ribohydrolase